MTSPDCLHSNISSIQRVCKQHTYFRVYPVQLLPAVSSYYRPLPYWHTGTPAPIERGTDYFCTHRLPHFRPTNRVTSSNGARTVARLLPAQQRHLHTSSTPAAAAKPDCTKSTETQPASLTASHHELCERRGGRRGRNRIRQQTRGWDEQ